MKTKFHAAKEPIKKLRQIQLLFAAYFVSSPTFPLPLLAGGSIRDDYMGQGNFINDYDIFIKDVSDHFTEDGNFEEVISGMIERVFPRNDTYELLFDNEYQTLEEQHADKADVKPGSHNQIASVWEIDEEGLTYQMIFTKNDPIVHVEKYFDIGFCKAYCDGKKIRYTDDFLHDVKNRTLTIVGDEMTEEQVNYAIYHHAEKLQWRYDNFRVVVPHRYQKFVEDQGFPTF
jgi:hypothetical protein